MKYCRYEPRNYRTIMETYSVGSLSAKVVDYWGYDAQQTASFFRGARIAIPQADCLEKASAILKEAAARKQKAFVYGDYDCDGICATAIMVKLLQKLGISCGYYIPNRFNEGYGLNLERVRQAREKGYELLITVDNGVSAFEAVDWARKNGMTVLISDHHELSAPINADCLVHPSLLTEEFRWLCGAGVAYVLMEYLGLADEKMKICAMVATIGDVMELRDYNVQLVREGLKALAGHRYRNMEALLEGSEMIDENAVSFRIVPKINAVGRLADRANPNQLVRYFLAEDEKVIDDFAAQLSELNNTRKQMSLAQYETVRKKLDLSHDFLMVRDESLHEGLIGLMASRLCDETGRSCLIFTESNGLLKGSGRGNETTDLFDLLKDYAPYTMNFGGHKGACGITIRPEQYDELREYIARRYVSEAVEKEEYYIEITEGDLTKDNLEELFSHKPFGQGRKLPLFLIRTDDSWEYRSLKNDNQLKWSKRLQQTRFDIVSFRNNKGYREYLDRDTEALGNLEINVFRGVKSYQLLALQLEIARLK
ncbi:MAG: DHH family phosphoesterase [Erysipelotrichaceae bacterium]|nr:DHH family phosphoesterase [Erysipelotrichaceae bacterium]